VVCVGGGKEGGGGGGEGGREEREGRDGQAIHHIVKACYLPPPHSAPQRAWIPTHSTPVSHTLVSREALAEAPNDAVAGWMKPVSSRSKEGPSPLLAAHTGTDRASHQVHHRDARSSTAQTRQSQPCGRMGLLVLCLVCLEPLSRRPSGRTGGQ